MEILLVILLAFSFSYVLGEIMERMKLPKVLAPIFVGFIMGLPTIRPIILSHETLSVLDGFANLGLVFIMFFVGLEIDISAFKSSMRRSALIAFFSAAIPFTLGYFVCIWIGFKPIISAIIGACLSVTAEAISIDILQELGILRTKLGQIVIEAGILDDLVEIFLIAGIVAYVQSFNLHPAVGILTIMFEVFSFLLFIYVLRWFMIPKILKFSESKNSKTDMFVTFMIITLLMAVASSFLGLGAVIGAFAAGMMIRHLFIEEGDESLKKEEKVTETIEIVTFGLLAPFFFLYIGASVSLESLMSDPMLGILFTLIAFAGKLFGSILGNALGGGPLKEGIAIGWGMNARGAVELVAAKLAFEYGLINDAIFSALVFMTFVTTIVSPVVFKHVIHKYHIRREKPFQGLMTLAGFTKKIFKRSM